MNYGIYKIVLHVRKYSCVANMTVNLDYVNFVVTNPFPIGLKTIGYILDPSTYGFGNVRS